MKNPNFKETLKVEHRNYKGTEFDKGGLDGGSGTFIITSSDDNSDVHITFSLLIDNIYMWIKDNIWGSGDDRRLRIVLDSASENGVFYFKTQKKMENNHFEYRHNLPSIFTKKEKDKPVPTTPAPRKVI